MELDPISFLEGLDLEACGEKLFQNEAGGKLENLVFWSEKELFPSVGIAHFIWIPSHLNTSFKDSFGPFLSYCEKNGIGLPEWIGKTKEHPWKDRTDFLNDQERPALLKQFLQDHFAIQFQYVLEQFFHVLPTLLKSLKEEYPEAEEYVGTLLATPKGFFALYDYVSFKGMGLYPQASYGGINWGAKQVLERALQMNWKEEPLHSFIQAAKDTLQNRVNHAPEEKKEIEKSYLKGWFARLDRYALEE